MNKCRWPTVLVVLALPAVIAAAEQTVTPGQVGVEDADTLLVRVEDTVYRIQLPGVDAPESLMNPKLRRDMGRTALSAETLLPLGHSAVDGLQRLLPAFEPYRLVFDPDITDRYGRTPGDLVDGDGVSLSLRLVESGYAIPVGPPASRSAQLSNAVARARQAGVGLWGAFPQTAAAWAGRARPR